jgi:hypothetical protein
MVICCKHGADEALASMWRIMQRLRLRVNAQASLQHVIERTPKRHQTTRKTCQLEADEMVQTLNRKLRGRTN